MKQMIFGVVLLVLGFQVSFAASPQAPLPVSQQLMAQFLSVSANQLPIGSVIPRGNILAAIGIVVRLSGQSPNVVYADFVKEVKTYCQSVSNYPYSCDQVQEQAHLPHAKFVIR